MQMLSYSLSQHLLCSINVSFIFYLFILLIYLFVRLSQVFIMVGSRILVRGGGALVPWPGIEPRTPVLGAQSFSHSATREVPVNIYFSRSQLSQATYGK